MWNRPVKRKQCLQLSHFGHVSFCNQLYVATLANRRRLLCRDHAIGMGVSVQSWRFFFFVRFWPRSTLEERSHAPLYQIVL